MKDIQCCPLLNIIIILQKRFDFFIQWLSRVHTHSYNVILETREATPLLHRLLLINH